MTQTSRGEGGVSYPTSLYVLTYTHVYVDLQFYPWFNFFFFCFKLIIRHYRTVKRKKRKFKPKIKLNQKIYNRTLYLVYTNIKEKDIQTIKSKKYITVDSVQRNK